MEIEQNKEMANAKYDAIINFIEEGVNNIFNEKLYKKIMNKEMIIGKLAKLKSTNNDCSYKDCDIMYINSDVSKSIINVHIDNNDKENLKDFLIDLFLRCMDKRIYRIAVPVLALKKSDISFVQMKKAIHDAYEFFVDKKEYSKLEIIGHDYLEKSNKPRREKNPIFKQANINAATTNNSLINFEPGVMHFMANNHNNLRGNISQKLKNDRIYQNAMAIGNINPNDFQFVDYENFTGPLDFVYAVVHKSKLEIEKEVIKATICDRRRPGQLFKQKTVSNLVLFTYGAIFNFNQTLMTELLICNGRSYNPNDPVDDYFYGYFSGVYGTFNSFDELEEDFFNETGKYLNLTKDGLGF